ncbi:MAG: hypothetical protein ACD_2C00038G0009 [uncultured bacterium (gcode 4)]|uniref:Uncharacterized protein n=1 Tax=uncultured bacterium (gcode 4) TaxID=1234023 RepID=K2G745_9BACT|nr:MAG: hypothetical protein ACD_2C00038G0009 [uncultured bacterium (gcode 4)]
MPFSRINSISMKKHNIKWWFTLVELLIVITIIWILSIWVFVPYNLYSNIAKVRLSEEIITQSMSESRNSAAWLVDVWTQKNQNIVLFINKWEEKIWMYSFPFDYSGSLEASAWNKIKDITLESWVKISLIKDNADQEKNDVIFLFKAPEWKMEVYKDATFTWSIKEIIIWFKEAKKWILSKTLSY